MIFPPGGPVDGLPPHIAEAVSMGRACRDERPGLKRRPEMADLLGFGR